MGAIRILLPALLAINGLVYADSFSDLSSCGVGLSRSLRQDGCVGKEEGQGDGVVLLGIHVVEKGAVNAQLWCYSPSAPMASH